MYRVAFLGDWGADYASSSHSGGYNDGRGRRRGRRRRGALCCDDDGDVQGGALNTLQENCGFVIKTVDTDRVSTAFLLL